tara:strand:- start:25042 stop:25206 length:165 start_codon:yes stop_codon:yes gene_type:complete
MQQNNAVRLANHFPRPKVGDNIIARAEMNARVTKVSAIPLRQVTDPLDLHKQEE